MAKRERKGKRPAAAGAPPQAASASAAAAVAAQVVEPAPEAPATPAAPARSSRAKSNALIALFLLFQIAMPLRYYLGGGGYDERFSWRMFSSVRMQKCKVQVRDHVRTGGGEPQARDVNLPRELHVAWIGMLERYRPQVVDKLLRRRCAAPNVAEVEFVRSCVEPGGRKLPELEVRLDCARGAFTRRGDQQGGRP